MGSHRRWTALVVAALVAATTAAIVSVPTAGAVPAVQDISISVGADDAEEQADLSVSLSSSDLELALDGGSPQHVGLRFNNVVIAGGTAITASHLQFTTDEVGTLPTQLTIRAQLIADAPPFTTAPGDISSRPLTTASVTWNPPGWSVVGASGSAQRTPDISAVLQEVIDLGGWSSGNSIVIVVTGDGNGVRTAEARESSAVEAPRLHLEHGGTPGNEPPTVEAGDDVHLILPEASVCLGATASDDGIPGPLSVSWSQVGGPAATLTPAGATTASAAIAAPGVHIFEADADDTELTASDPVSVVVGNRIDVPGDAATIQGGIDLATDGDTVVVGPGTWFESVVIQDKTITLASNYLFTGDPADRAATIIDANGADHVVRFGSGVGPESTVVGFDLRDAVDGVLMFAPVNVFDNRVTETHDGLEYKNNSGGVARGNILENNLDDGVDVNRDSAVIVEQNLIRFNDGDGVEMRMNDYGGPLLESIYRHNVIHDNNNDGIQLIDYDGYSPRRVIIEHNLIYDNRDAGIGIMGGGATNETFEGAGALEEIIVSNNMLSGNDHGLTGGHDLTARNNILVNHTNIAMKNVDGGSTVSHTLFWNNGTDVVSSNIDGPSTVTADPLLDAGWAPTAGSPAIDAGTDIGFPFAGAAPDLGAVETPVNAAPVVDAGADMTVSRSTGPVPLGGSFVDDGLPAVPGAPVVSWSTVAGSCDVVFTDPTSPTSGVTFPAAGTYRLRLTADDGWRTTFDDVTVTVTDDPPVIKPFGGVVLEGTGATTVVDVSVSMSAAIGEPVTVDFTTVDIPSNPRVALSGSDYVAATGTLTFAPGQTEASVPITIIGDAIDEPPLLYGEWGVVSFSNPSANATLDLATFFGLGLFIIVDDD